ncbi:MAG TPA: RES family NAD+ phosphorylase [Bryobacteraceae bacterium]|nr:RES family NAD+ phosphorylase [Bryobacteraceae bacterium]
MIEIIRDLATADANAAEDVRRVLAVRCCSGDYAGLAEGDFDPDIRYRKHVYAREYGERWALFEGSLKTQSRYFNRDAESILEDIFQGLHGRRTKHERPIVVPAGPGTEYAELFRARVFESRREFVQALKQPDMGIGPPPSNLASAGRMNAAGISVFYGATDERVALAEVRPPGGSRVLVGRFEVVKRLKLLDLEAFDLVADPRGSPFDEDHVMQLKRTAFLRGLSRRISRPVMPHDELSDYLPTQAAADFLASSLDPSLDGVIYPSVQAGGSRRTAFQRLAKLGELTRIPPSPANVVLFHKVASVEPCLAKGAEVDVLSDKLFDFLNDDYLDKFPGFADCDEEPTYRVVEKAKNAVAPSPQPDAALRLSSLCVHCIKAMKFETSSNPVHRSREETATKARKRGR